MNGNKINGVLEAEPGTTVTYKMSYCNSHTLHFNFKAVLALSKRLRACLNPRMKTEPGCILIRCRG